MTEELAAQIAELQQVHRGLTEITEKEHEIVLSGPLPFEASADRHISIADSFDIELLIPDVYPRRLPQVREAGGKIDSSYEHVYSDGTLCLAVPIEERQIFYQQPSLLSFVDKLVIPYFYGYCYWKECGEHPFGEHKHGAEGIVRYYIDELKLVDEVAALAVVCFLYEHGYRGHHACPCGSGLNVRKCHGPKLRELHQHHTPETLRCDFVMAFELVFSKFKAGHLSLPPPLRQQILRLVDRIKPSSPAAPPQPPA